MSRKPARPVQRPIPTANASDAQERLALVHLEKGRFRDAVDCYKKLVKTQRRTEWVDGLAKAYAGRAKVLAEKGMFREAIELWRSRTELCGTPLWEGSYIGWLVSDGRLDEVLGYLFARRSASGSGVVSDSKQNVEIAALEAQLAPVLLVADEAYVTKLPAETLLVQHRPLALAALTAYAHKDTPALEAALVGIPFRSPYRDLRLVLKAMLLWETDRSAARLAIDRLSEDGPFEPLAAPLRTLLALGAERLRRWGKLNHSQHMMALDLMGCPHTYAPLVRALAVANADADLAPSALFDLVQRHSRDLPESIATRAWQWLSPWAVRRGCENPRIFGNPTEVAQECAVALALDIQGKSRHAESHWSNAAQQMSDGDDANDRLRTALILRHMAYKPRHLSPEGILDKTGAEMLTKSLEFDVHDCDAFVRLVRFWRKHDDLKLSREHIDLGLRYFPNDISLLTESVETALAAGAIKKASTVALHLLELDPLNRQVPLMIGNAHLSHAVKYIAADNLKAAIKEINEATNWLSEIVDQARIHLLQAWTKPVGSDERLRLTHLAAAMWGGGLAAGWRLVREAKVAFTRFGLSSSVWLLDEAGIDSSKALTATDILDLALVLEQEPVHKAMDILAPWHKAIATVASTLVLDAQMTVRICEALSRHHEHDWVEKFANSARERWPDQPIFVYHAVAARFARQHCIENDRDYEDIEMACKQARQSKDLRLVVRIETLLHNDDDDDDHDDSEAEFDEAGLPDGTDSTDDPILPTNFEKMDVEEIQNVVAAIIKFDKGRSLLKEVRKAFGETLYKMIVKVCDGDSSLVLRTIVGVAISGVAHGSNKLPPSVVAEILKYQKPSNGRKIS
jgi:tetratricopeptide (TPR) repeat protein